MGMLRKILRAVLHDDGAPSLYSGLIGSPADPQSGGRMGPGLDDRKTKTATRPTGRQN
jgi:hypothetical protein